VLHLFFKGKNSQLHQIGLEWTAYIAYAFMRLMGGSTFSARLWAVYRALPPRIGFRQSTRQDFKGKKPQIQGIWAYNSAFDSFNIKLAIQKTAKANKHG